jgi:ATP-binding cassette subfamily C (CFTR/MRP) protein 1
MKNPSRLCIAHRLATIAFYDRVLVLDQGTIVEFASPLTLYDQKISMFRGMCDAARLDRGTIQKMREQE